MINSQELSAFWEIVDENLDDVPIVAASEDPDLQALFELRIIGETERVKPRRAELIEACDTQQLYDEIQRGYGLSLAEMAVAVEICEKRVLNEARAKLEWRE